MTEKIIYLLFAVCLGIRPFIPGPISSIHQDIIYSLFVVSLGFTLYLLNIKRIVWKNNPIFLSIAVLFLAYSVSTLFSMHAENSLSKLYNYSGYLAVFLAVYGLSSQEQKFLQYWLLTSAVLVGISAIQWLSNGAFTTLDFLNDKNIHWNFAREYILRGRAFIPFVFPADLGGYMIMFIPTALAILNNNTITIGKTKFSFKNVLALFAFFITTLTLLCTQSIGAIISLLIATCVFLFLKKKKIGYFLFLICGLLFAVLLGLLFYLRSTSALYFNMPLFSFFSRIDYWHNALKLIQNHPFTGLGTGNYPFFRGWWAHNSYLQIWVEMGILGFAAFSSLAIISLKENFYGLEEKQRRLMWALWIGNLAFLIHNLADSTFFRPEVCLQWWAILAILCSTRAKNTP